VSTDYANFAYGMAIGRLGRTGRGVNWETDYFYELTLLTESIYLFTDVQVPMLICCCYLQREPVRGKSR